MADIRMNELTLKIFEIIEENILNGVYAKGTILDEDKLALELIVGKSTVREAIAMLGIERLVAETAAGFVVLGVDEEDIRDIVSVKRLLEVKAAGMTAENISGEALAKLQQIVEEQERHLAEEDFDAKVIRNLDTKFHDLIFAECGSVIYESILSPMHHKLSKHRRDSLTYKARLIASVAEHRKIFDAIAARDTAAAEDAMSMHIEHAYAGMMQAH